MKRFRSIFSLTHQDFSRIFQLMNYYTRELQGQIQQIFNRNSLQYFFLFSIFSQVHFAQQKIKLSEMTSY